MAIIIDGKPFDGDAVLTSRVIAPPPDPVDCVLGEWVYSEWVAGEWGPCVNGLRRRTETRTWMREVLTPPAHGGLECGPTSGMETREISEPCTVEPPPDDNTIGVVLSRPLNASSLLIFRDYMSDSTTYQRWQDYTITEGDVHAVEVRAIAALAGVRAFSSNEYALLIDGIEHARVTPDQGASIVKINIRCSEIAAGWHMIDFSAVPGNNETCIPYFIFVKRAGMAKTTKMPVVRSSYEGQRYDSAMWAWVPAQFNPTVVPLPARIAEPFETALTRRELYVEEVVPARRGDIYRPRETNGVLNTGNVQNYTMSPLLEKYPDKALLDGPRGFGTINGVTSLVVGHSGYWFTDAWSFGRVKFDGTVQRLAGIRSRVPAGRNVGSLASDFDLIGDWANVPQDRRGFHEVWGFAWVASTLAIDFAAPPVMRDGQLANPHVTEPVVLIADSQHNRIVRVKFSANQENAPGVVDEFIAGLNDPWDCVCTPDDKLLVSERRANKITMWDAKTGAFVRTILQGPSGYAAIESDLGGTQRKALRLASLDAIRQQNCIMPEGLFYQDGWCYFGSLAMQQVNRVKVDTGEVQTVVDLHDIHVSFIGAQYVKIAVSDGSFGPRGAIAVQLWTSNNYLGAPLCYLPDGSMWQALSPTAEGPGKVVDYEYGSAVAFGRGRMVFGTSIEGLMCVTKSQPGDSWFTWDGGHHAGWVEWKRLGLNLTHGNAGFGYYGLSVPWGRSQQTDALLVAYGHKRSS